VPGEAFLFENFGGYADPVGANQDLIEAVTRLGGTVEFNKQVVDVLREGARVTGVRLADGSEISAGLVINASGPWCNQLNAMAGADLRWTLTPTRVQTVYRSWPAELGPLPVAADLSTGIYFRPQSGGQQILVGSVLAEDEEEAVDDPDNFKRVPDADFTEMKLAAFHHRVPALEARGAVTGVAGLYTVNREDVHPVVGPTEVEGFWVANGFSGHGFKLAPALGSMLAQAVTGLSMEFDTDVPMSFLSVDRQPIDLAVKNVLA
jgi:glycine/D-amino acid oxidase-like deaminating enzyme